MEEVERAGGRVVVMEGDVRWRTADKVGRPRVMGLPYLGWGTRRYWGDLPALAGTPACCRSFRRSQPGAPASHAHFPPLPVFPSLLCPLEFISYHHELPYWPAPLHSPLVISLSPRTTTSAPPPPR